MARYDMLGGLCGVIYYYDSQVEAGTRYDLKEVSI